MSDHSWKRFLIIPVILIVFFFLFYLVYDDIKKRTIDEFNNEQLILAGTAAQGITTFFSDYQADLAFLSQLPDIIDYTSESNRLLASFYQNHKNLIEAITRVDEHGIIRLTYPANESVTGRDISYQKHVQQVIATHQPVISDVFVSAQGYDAIALHVPVFKGKEFKGSLAMLISIDELGKRYLSKIEIRGTGNVWLMSANGIEIYCPVSEHTGKLFLQNTSNDSSAIKFSNTIRKEKKGTAKSTHQGITKNGETRYIEKYVVFYRALLGNTYWTIVISYQEEDIYVVLTALRNRLIFVFSLLFVIISYYFYSLVKVSNVLKEEARRKKAEQEILVLAHALRSVNECVSITDSENNILFVNEAFSRTYGYSEEELKGKKIDFLRSTTCSSESLNEILQATLNGEWRGELINTRKDGSEFPIYLSTTTIKDKTGKPLGLIGVASDITERKRNEAELVNAKNRAEESDHLKSAFLANMSHEIRTPMNGILGFAGLLKEPGLNSEEQQEYLSIIEKSGARMLNIINDIVDISKIESGQMEVTLSETNISEQIEFINNFFKPEVENKGLQLLCKNSLSPDEIHINTDREKLYAILANLVKNAIKYTIVGTIELGCRKDDAFLKFFIRDTGIGIPKKRQEAIFERFIQADFSDKMAQQGAGLGLSIAKAYVELLGGKIWLESEQGKGSTFCFTIPYLPVNVNTANPAASHPEKIASQDKKLKILIAEDDDSSQMLVSVFVKKFSKEILVAKTGNEAVEICRANPDLDLVLMDIQLPEMNGYEATRQIRQFNKEVIIIAQTAFAFTGDREKAIAAGCNDYIVKPIRKLELLALIKTFYA